MQKCDHVNLPDGPAGECHFQPPQEKLRNKDGLLRQNAETRSKKRKAAAMEATNGESMAEPADDRTQPTLTERLASERERMQIRHNETGPITEREIDVRRNQRFPVHHEQENIREYPPTPPPFAGVEEAYRGPSLAGRDWDEDCYDT